MIRDEEIRERYPYWREDNLCLRCDNEVNGVGLMYCGTCYREGNRNSGIVGPLFKYGSLRGWR